LVKGPIQKKIYSFRGVDKNAYALIETKEPNAARAILSETFSADNIIDLDSNTFAGGWEVNSKGQFQSLPATITTTTLLGLKMQDTYDKTKCILYIPLAR